MLVEIDLTAGRLLRTVCLPSPPTSVVVVAPVPAAAASQHTGLSASAVGARATAAAAAAASITPRLLVVGLGSEGGRPGAVLSFALPLTPDASCTRVGSVPGGVVTLKLTADCGRLLVAGGDGSLVRVGVGVARGKANVVALRSNDVG